MEILNLATTYQLEESLIKLIDSSKNKFINNPMTMAPIDYLNKLYSKVDKTKLIPQDLSRLIKDCQDSIDDPQQTSTNFAFKFLSLIKYLQPLREVQTNRIQLIPSISTIIRPFGDIESKLTEVEKQDEKQVEVICLSDDDNDETCEESNDDERDNNQSLSHEDFITLNRIQELDELCQSLNNEIKAIEKAELSIEELNSDQSSYLKEEILRKHLNEAFTDLNRLIEENPHLVDTEIEESNTEPTVFKYTGTSYPQINQKIEEKYNKNQSIPEFSLMTEWLKEANDESSLGLNQEKMNYYAEEAMRELVRLAKDKRKDDMNQIHNSRVKRVEPELFEHNSDVYENEDPALKDAELNKTLNENRKLADEKHKKILEEFIFKQLNNQNGLEDDVDKEDEDEEDEENDFEIISVKEPADSKNQSDRKVIESSPKKETYVELIQDNAQHKAEILLEQNEISKKDGHFLIELDKTPIKRTNSVTTSSNEIKKLKEFTSETSQSVSPIVPTSLSAIQDDLIVLD